MPCWTGASWRCLRWAELSMGDVIGGIEAALTPVWRGEARQVGRLTADENRQTPRSLPGAGFSTVNAAALHAGAVQAAPSRSLTARRVPSMTAPFIWTSHAIPHEPETRAALRCAEPAPGAPLPRRRAAPPSTPGQPRRLAGTPGSRATVV